MLRTYTFREYPVTLTEEQQLGRPQRRPVVVVGAGPIGLTAALDCAHHGIPVLLLDDNNTVSVGSRAVCSAKRPLEIWDRLGCATRMVEKGVSWSIGKVFYRDRLAYSFDLLPQRDHHMPAMINLQQYYIEEYLTDRCLQFPKLIDLHWKHTVVGLETRADHVALRIESPSGAFTTEADWVIACDGANSALRDMVGAPFAGQLFNDRFLIADVVMKADFPAERWFWFDPPFHPGQSALLHKQADDVWRIDFQLGADADVEAEKRPERIVPRIEALLGPARQFELEWTSIYQFACRRIDRFRHGRVLFAGDAAHQVSPFGARGANTGVQDADNLVWKLKLVLEGRAPQTLLDSYDAERGLAADDNLRASTRSTEFITPKTRSSRIYRTAVLELAAAYPFARPLVNSGRLSTPTPYLESPLNTPDQDPFAGRMAPGTNCDDAPVSVGGRADWLLHQVGTDFTVLVFGAAGAATVTAGKVTARVLQVGPAFADDRGVLSERYDARPGTTYLLRPDQHVAARWRRFDEAQIRAALARSTGQT